MERWVGRVAIVSGASSGIGAAVSKSLVESGLKVVGVARRVEKVEELAEELKSQGAKGELHPVCGDVTKEEDIKRVVQWTRKTLGGADVLVNNAGVNRYGKLSEQATDDVKLILDTNVIALTVFTKAVVQDMKSRGVNDGHIFNINSICGHYISEYPLGYIYTASKHAVTVVTEGLRRELRDMQTQIRVTSISPGLVKTEISVAGGLSKEVADKKYSENPCLEAKDIADALTFALGAPGHVQIHEMVIRATGEFIL
ncbi:farnesol dehydrogenase-like [Neocloeon triangulifer]|uniref:farnesol dehydrogenase-like n=1 Tax=Neocloeon triangulifer TaxID=2078957 RepID=UPI00286F7079|nr:farnesol dehydrogenase-like [Neocloeon triangulifer]